MKKTLLTLIVILTTAFGLTCMAQNAEQTTVNTLEGNWQMCMFQQGDSGKFNIRILPIIKTYSPAGTFTTLITRSFGGSCGIVDEGTFKKAEDSTLVETSTEETTYTYHLKGQQWLVLDSKDAEGKTTHQIWMRLRKMPNAKQTMESIMKGEGPRGFGRPGREGMRPQFKPGNDTQSPKGRRGGQRRGFGNNGNFQRGGNDSPIDNSWMDED